MFTGLIEAIGRVVSIEQRADASRMAFACGELGLSDTRIGDSVAINGVCLTVVDMSSRQFAADLSAETLACTTLGKLKSRDEVNLEKALLPTTRLGGHLVSGHVDGVGRVVEITPVDGSLQIHFSVPQALLKYIARKGSICVDGVSLTINAVTEHGFEVNIIPHTQQKTIISGYRVGSDVNIEVDVVARYLERLLLGSDDVNASGATISRELLASRGFDVS